MKSTWFPHRLISFLRRPGEMLCTLRGCPRRPAVVVGSDVTAHQRAVTTITLSPIYLYFSLLCLTFLSRTISRRLLLKVIWYDTLGEWDSYLNHCAKLKRLYKWIWLQMKSDSLIWRLQRFLFRPFSLSSLIIWLDKRPILSNTWP